MITLPSLARSRLLDYFNHLKGMREELSTLKADLAANKASFAELDASLNFRERHLRGYLGGDRNKVRRHEELLDEIADLEARYTRKSQAIDGIQLDIFRLLDQELCADPGYKALAIMCGDGRAAQASAKHLMQLLRRALREVDEAQTANIMDAAGIDTMSAYDYVATDEARQAVAAVNSYLPTFQEFVGRFMRADGAGPAVPNLDSFLAALDITDLVLDYGFGDFAQIGELDRTEQALQAYLAKAEAVTAQIAAILVPLLAKRKTFHDEVVAALH